MTLGTLAPVTGTYVVDSGICTLGRDSLINIVREGWEAPYNAFTIQVLSDITAETGRNPTQGSFKVTGGFPDTVSLTVVTSPSPGATISLNNGAQETYTWDELYALYLDENEEYWRWQASLSALIITRVIEEVIFSGDTLLQIEVNDDLLEDDGSITYSGSPFPGSTPLGGARSTGDSDTELDRHELGFCSGPRGRLFLELLLVLEQHTLRGYRSPLFRQCPHAGFP